ncbi:MAG: hypothetical protein G01um101433_315 [Parcubacteria group bacterium Gr01-1014_33]|nr:MAG: hypothetical protein G01um101433_315 [Parcubacteria group bacterium Gr01-1014_33]
MRQGDIVQKISIAGFSYARILTSGISLEEAEGLKKKFRYLHVYSYARAHILWCKERVQRTALIDLNQGVDDIFKKYSDTCKKHIRRGEKNADLKIVSEDKDSDASYRLYREVKKEEGAKPDIKKEFDNCLFFNAYYNGRMIVTMSFYDNGEYIRAKHTASLRREMGERAKVSAHASRMLIWEMCKWGKRNNRKFFDLAGLNLDDPSKKGIVEFKRSFGGDEMDIYMYRYATPAFSALKRVINLFGKNIN